MGWKAVKQHYRITHIVHMTPEGLCVGSDYITDLIVIGRDGAVSKRYDGRSNADLLRYQTEFDADPEKLRELFAMEDQFAAAIKVYTYAGAQILEKYCEATGYPNVTHDGCLIYENTFSTDRDQVVSWAKRNAALGVKYTEKSVRDLERQLATFKQRLVRERSQLADLCTEYPNVAFEAPEED